jgi:PadR family transcriptional regulator, regulatory protein PadR
MEGAAVKGHLDLLLLSVLEDGAGHGYALSERLRSRSAGAFDFPEGTIYPALHRLERRGLLRSRWEVVDGRRRRVYELTARGGEALGRRRSAWREFARSMESVVGAPA